METRAQLERKVAAKDKEKREEGLRQLAQKAREERAGIRRVDAGRGTVIPGDCVYKLVGE